MKTIVAILEVMDKEPSLLHVWLLFLIVGVGGFLLGRYRTWLLFIVLPVATYLAWDHFSELRDPYIGPDILNEAGRSYFIQSYVAMGLSIILPLLSLIRLRGQSSSKG